MIIQGDFISRLGGEQQGSSSKNNELSILDNSEFQKRLDEAIRLGDPYFSISQTNLHESYFLNNQDQAHDIANLSSFDSSFQSGVRYDTQTSIIEENAEVSGIPREIQDDRLDRNEDLNETETRREVSKADKLRSKNVGAENLGKEVKRSDKQAKSELSGAENRILNKQKNQKPELNSTLAQQRSNVQEKEAGRVDRLLSDEREGSKLRQVKEEATTRPDLVVKKSSQEKPSPNNVNLTQRTELEESDLDPQANRLEELMVNESELGKEESQDLAKDHVAVKESKGNSQLVQREFVPKEFKEKIQIDDRRSLSRSAKGKDFSGTNASQSSSLKQSKRFGPEDITTTLQSNLTSLSAAQQRSGQSQSFHDSSLDLSALVETADENADLNTLTSFQGRLQTANGVQARGLVSSSYQQMRSMVSNEILKQAKFIIQNDSKGEVRLMLKPASLGLVRIRMDLLDNSVALKVFVENSDVKEMLQSALAELQEGFLDHGYDASQVEVFIGDKNNSGAEKDLNRGPKEKTRTVKSFEAQSKTVRGYIKQGDQVDITA